MKIYDVLVVGAGPAGSIFSSEICDQMSVLVLESKQSTTRTICGEYLCPLGVKYLNEMGYSDSLLGFNKVLGMNIVTPNEVVVETFFPETSVFSEKGVSLNRKKFDSFFVEKAKSRGVEFKFNMNVSDISHNGSYWEVTTHAGENFYCRLLIGADGRRSIVSKKLNLTRKSSSNKIAIHTWVSGKNDFSRSGQMHLFDDGSYIGIDPINENEVNVSLVCDSSKVKEHSKASNTLINYLNKSSLLSDSVLSLDEIEKVFCVYPVGHSTSGAISKDAALIGDAAGFLDPLTGEGVFNAIWMARHLADSLKTNQNSLFNNNLALKEFEKKRKQFFRQKKVVNTIFQWIIKKPVIVEVIGKFLNLSSKKRNSFVGIIGNIYSPVNGILKILF